MNSQDVDNGLDRSMIAPFEYAEDRHEDGLVVRIAPDLVAAVVFVDDHGRTNRSLNRIVVGT